MPDLGGTLSLSLSRCPTLKSLPLPPPLPPPPPPAAADHSDLLVPSTSVNGDDWGRPCEGNSIRVPRRNGLRKGGGSSSSISKCLEDYVRIWVEEKMESGASRSRCFLPFFVGAKRLAECLVCHGFINPGKEVWCSVRDCKGVYHSLCVEERLGILNLSKFKCPQHVCFICKQKFQWRCVRCEIASHDKCAAWPDKVIHLINQPGRVVCWRHPTNWRFDQKHMIPTRDMEEVFCHLPLPYADEEFQIDLTWKGQKENKLEPPSYVHIRRNVYLVKKKRDGADSDVGCTSCSSTCSEGCVCRVQCISCSKACRCSEKCNNRPFRKEKKIKIVKTEFCGWGVEAAEPLNKGDFVIEYIGEVIDDALCEQRLWDMKYKGVENFYMCEIRKDFTIDATFKGNASRFLNHSCDPNCFLEKWQVEGETRVGVFAARSIKVGEPLTYDYRFVQFGQEVKCYCGASNCQGFLGMKRKVCKLNICWGAKKRRSSNACLAIIAM